MSRLLLLIITGLLFTINIDAQVLWTDPPFPNDNEIVTVYFDAAEGTGGLADCGCDVYFHSGLITDQSTGPSNWKHVFTSWGVTNPDWLMTAVAGQPNVYSLEISPSIRDYYNVPSNITIEKLAFVFRNGDGSLEGKDVGGMDIFYDVYPEGSTFTASLLAPSSTTIIANIGETIEINGVASSSATMTITEDGNELSQTISTSILYSLVVSDPGTHTVVFTADNGIGEVVTESFVYAVPVSNVIASLPDGVDNGVNYIDDNNVVLVLYAPSKQNVFVWGDFNGWSIDTDFQMKKTPDGTTWWIEIAGLNVGEEYGFQYLVDGDLKIADPYSEKILDPWNDVYVDDSVYPNLKAYPQGLTTGNVSVFETGQEPYDWTDDNYQRPEKERLVIYELLMRDFLESHSFSDLLDTLDYLDRLGVSAIELMPVNEFEGNQSWGYNPSFHGALDKYYGTPEMFQDFVDEAHNRGIAVILDVVYNHAFSQSPLAQLYWDGPNFQPTADNPWLNPTPKHPFNVGYDFNHESAVTKDYVKQTLSVWVEKYHIDGFRFDLSKGFTQHFSTNNSQMAAYDASRIAILKDYADYLWSIDTDSYVILEHFGSNNEEEELAEYGMLLWGNTNHDFNEASMGYPSNLSWVSHKSRNWDVPNLIGYMESHDEERQMYKNLQYGNSSASYDVTELETALSRVELTSTFMLSIPGPKMLWQFVELGYDNSINRCTDGTISSNCRLDPKPILWNYQDNENRTKIYDVISKVNYLKRNEDIFSTNDFEYSLTGSMKSIHLNSPSKYVTVLGNFGVTINTIDPNFQQEGWWYEVLTGDSLFVENVNSSIVLNAGGYRMYSSEKFIVSNKEIVKSSDKVSVYPNPTTGDITLSLKIDSPQFIEVELFDLSGRLLKRLFKGKIDTYSKHKLQLDNKNEGIFMLRIKTDKETYFKKIIVQ